MINCVLPGPSGITPLAVDNRYCVIASEHVRRTGRLVSDLDIEVDL